MLSKIYLLAACIAGARAAAGAMSQTPTAQASGSTANTASATILAGSLTTGMAASVISAGSCETTYQLVCTDANSCSSSGFTVTVTEGSTDFRLAYATSNAGASGSVSETCSVSGSSYAVCSLTFMLSGDGIKTSTAAVITASGTDVVYGTFPITAGGSKLASATGSCTASGNAAVPSGVVEVYKVLVAPVAVAAMAGYLL